jgi:flagellar hook assembly protein FlgD
VTLSANPFSPGVTPVPPTLLAQIGANGPGLAVIAQPTAPVDPAQTKGTIAIYDAVGDVVISEPLLVGNGVYYFVWNGDNRDHRAVGTGTYLAMVRMFTNNQQSYVKRVMVGVRR